MPSATVTSKGQITIPKDVREHLGLEAGDRVVFVVQSDRDVVLKPAKTDLRELHGMLYRKGQRPRSRSSSRTLTWHGSLCPTSRPARQISRTASSVGGTCGSGATRQRPSMAA